jgi:hypothetical protein
MSSLHIPLGSQESLRELFSDMPAAPKGLIKRGFSVVAKMPESAFSPLLKAAIATTGQRSFKREEELATSLNITP